MSDREPALVAATAPSAAAAFARAVRPWRLEGGRVLGRLDEVVVGSLPVVVVCMMALGAALSDQAARQAMRLLGDTSFVGPEYIVLGAEQFGPLLIALVLAQRVGAGFAAEVATLTSEDTLAADMLYRLDPVGRRLAPMAVALSVGGVVLGLCGALAWELAGALALWARMSVNPFTFVRLDALSTSSVGILLGKDALFGALVFWMSCRAGLAARGGATAVGRAAADAVVHGVTACLACNLVVDVVTYALRSRP